MNILNYRNIGLASIAAVCVAISGARAATVIWDPTATTVSGDSDISTQGVFTRAYAFSLQGNGPGATFDANGVTFTTYYAQGGPPVAGITFSASTVHVGQMSTSTVAPYANLSTGYQNVLRHYNWAQTSGTLTMTLTGLTAGQSYLLQIWFADPFTNGRPDANYSIAGVASPILDPNTTNAAGGLGQFVNATVTLGAGETSFSILAPNGSGISALQLRAIPEINTVSALMFGGVCLFSMVYYRRRRG